MLLAVFCQGVSDRVGVQETCRSIQGIRPPQLCSVDPSEDQEVRAILGRDANPANHEQLGNR